MGNSGKASGLVNILDIASRDLLGRQEGLGADCLDTLNGCARYRHFTEQSTILCDPHPRLASRRVDAKNLATNSNRLRLGEGDTRFRRKGVVHPGAVSVYGVLVQYRSIQNCPILRENRYPRSPLAESVGGQTGSLD